MGIARPNETGTDKPHRLPHVGQQISLLYSLLFISGRMEIALAGQPGLNCYPASQRP